MVGNEEDIGKWPPSKVAEALSDYNDWRRCKGKYEWKEKAEDNVPFPLSASQLGKVLDKAVEILRKDDK